MPRDPAQPRVEVARLEPVDGDLEAERDLHGVRIVGDHSGLVAPRIGIENASIDGARFTGAELSSIRLLDVIFANCELSGVDLGEASLVRVRFVNCRMSGCLFPRAKLRDVSFVGCRLDDGNLRMLAAERARFDSVDLRRAELIGATFVESAFYDCNLDGVEFSGSKLIGAGLQGSSLEGIKGAASLFGVVIDSSQVLPLALPLLGALDIAIDDTRGDGRALGADPPAGR